MDFDYAGLPDMLLFVICALSGYELVDLKITICYNVSHGSSVPNGMVRLLLSSLLPPLPMPGNATGTGSIKGVLL